MITGKQTKIMWREWRTEAERALLDIMEEKYGYSPEGAEKMLEFLIVRWHNQREERKNDS